MAWLDIFKRKKSCECFICNIMCKRKDAVEVKYRYGDGEGKIGTAYMCNGCDAKYNTQEDEDHGESI